MNQSEDPRELERQLELASRIASSITDQTTVERLRAWIEDLKQKLRHRLEARRIRQEITARAREEQSGRPSGRDLEFWLHAEHLRLVPIISNEKRRPDLLAGRPGVPGCR